MKLGLSGCMLLCACAGPRPLADGWQGDGRGWFDAELVRGFDETGAPIATLALSVQHRHLIFRRQPDGFTARYRIRAIQRDGGQAVRSQEWGGELRVADYAATRSSDTLRRTVRFALPAATEHDLQIQVNFSIEGTQRRASRVLAARALAPGSSGIALAELGLYSLRDPTAPPPEAQLLGPGELPDPDLFRPAEQIAFDVTTGPPYVLVRVFDLSGGARDSLLAIEWAPKTSLATPIRIELRRRGVENAILLPLPATMLPYGASEIVVRASADATRSVGVRNLGIDLEEDESWGATLRQIEELATSEALTRLRGVAAGEREAAWLAFWAKLDPTPETANERLAEHYRRVGHARRYLADGQSDGVTSDRGRVYVLHGEPDRIEDIPPRWDDPSVWQLWHYDTLGLSFYFRQTQGGQFRLAGSERA